MFLDNKYTRWYYHIIENRKVNPISDAEYKEKHHIIPRSLGGSDDSSNIIHLSAREHYIVHMLLVKMCESKDNRLKMGYALAYMTSVTRIGKISARQFALVKTIASKSLKGVPRSEETKTKIREARSRQIITEETKELWRKNRKGVPKSEEHKRNISLANKGKHSRIQSEEEKQKRALSLLGKNKGRKHQIVECPHCGRSGGLPIMKRHHFDNCKAIPR